MNRRMLLTVGGSSVITGMSGCIDELQSSDPETSDTSNETDDNGVDGNSNGDGSESEGELKQEQCEEDASPREFNTLQLGKSNILSEEPEEWFGPEDALSKHVTTEDQVPDLYGLILNSKKDTENIDREMLNTFEVKGGSTAETNDQPSEFIANTEFDDEAVILLRFWNTQSPTLIEVDFVGAIADETTYLRVTRSTGPLDVFSEALTLVRVEKSSLPDTLVVKDTFESEDGTHLADAFHTEQEAE